MSDIPKFEVDGFTSRSLLIVRKPAGSSVEEVQNTLDNFPESQFRSSQSRIEVEFLQATFHAAIAGIVMKETSKPAGDLGQHE